MTATFQPWEIPTLGRPPRFRVTYEDAPDGRRFVAVDSPWVLAVRRPSGALVPLDRIGRRWLEPGDELISPLSATEPVDAHAVLSARMTGYREWQDAHTARFDAAGDVIELDDDEPRRWWWHRRELPSGLVLHLHQASANARLSVSVAGDIGFQGSWCYENHDDGWRAVLGWNGWGDPPDGWIRHLETARRRKDGTAESEYVLAYEQGSYR